MEIILHGVIKRSGEKGGKKRGKERKKQEETELEWEEVKKVIERLRDWKAIGKDRIPNKV